MVLHGRVAREAGSQSAVQKRGLFFFQKILILQRGELVWTVAGLLVMPKVSDS